MIDFTSPEPLWRQVESVIRQRIADGTYPPRTAIPSLLRLTQEFGVAEMTVRKAVNAMKREGVLTGVSGKGTYVAGK